MQTKSWPIGATCILFAATTFAFQPVFAAVIYTTGANPAGLLWIRFIGAAACLLTVLQLQKKPMNKLCWPSICLGVIYAAIALCYFSAIQHASASLVVILLYLFPILVMILARFVFKEQLSKLKITALAIALIGVLFAVGLNPKGSLIGILFSLAAALGYALYILLSNHYLTNKDIMVSTTYIFIGAALTYTLAALVTSEVKLPQQTSGWLAIAGLIVFSTVLPIIALNLGNMIIGASDTAILSTLEPIVTIFLAVLILNEELNLYRVAGGFMVVAAVIMISREKLATTTSQLKDTFNS
ncbi:DMT family transporter [Endozoicomonas sp. SM1973]|uniref:DMT family transporter n=1 Tax=Spartinivicinus marinus TaxID=2994442 RepID=A0A853I664_9GAMM|nr:DMT family transporter [Spartinivicinus marinus]MCX4028167.1 DMT family transporter [Spartinivicinus marinus]NYZ66158.1 DMT family transporter [Spartinivicinus marinus]